MGGAPGRAAGAGMMTFTLPFPVSANRYWRTFRNRVVKSDEARKYQDAAGWLAKAAGVQEIDGSVGLELRIYRPQRRGDLDNRIKVLLDAMQGILYADDGQVSEIHAYLDDDKHAPRVEVRAWEVQP
jgi:crossover junction endodeoxyribonuclease RusA